MSRRWTQNDENISSLPDGLQCIGYDTDTGRYIFIDRDGTKYKGEPGSKTGGKLERMLDHNQSFEQARPGAFHSPTSSTEHNRPNQLVHTTFDQFVPGHLITSPTSDSSKKTRKSNPISSASQQDPSVARDGSASATPAALRLKDAAKKSGKMQGVVQGFKGLVGSSKK